MANNTMHRSALAQIDAKICDAQFIGFNTGDASWKSAQPTKGFGAELGSIVLVASGGILHGKQSKI